MFISPEALDRFAQMRICQAPGTFAGRDDVVAVLTDDSSSSRVYIDYEIYDCAGNGNTITVRHALTPATSSDISIAAALSGRDDNLLVIQTNYSTLWSLMMDDLLHHFNYSDVFHKHHDLYQLHDIPNAYYELAANEERLYGIPAMVNASLIYIDAIALSRFSFPPARESSHFATFADLIDFCSTVNGRTGTEAQRQAAVSGNGKRDLSAADFKHPLALPLATPESRAKHFGMILRSLASQRQNGQWSYGAWLNPDGSAAFAGPAGIEALTTLRNVALACMGAAGLDYTDADLIEALQKREIAAAALDASAAAKIYGQRNTDLWQQYEQHLAGLASQPLPELENHAAALQAPISHSLMPRAGHRDNPVASQTDFKFFAFANKDHPLSELALQLILETTDQDSQESVKYFGVPTRRSIAPTPIDPRNFETTSDASPTNYEITHRSIELGLPPEVETVELTSAKMIVGQALANMLDPDFSPAATLAQAARDYETQR